MKSRRSKYKNCATEVDGILFDSKKEANRYGELKLLQLAEQIRDLRLQVTYRIIIRGKHVCSYIADFVYFDCQKKKEIIEDAKGFKTQIYRLKKKLVHAALGLEIVEV